MTSDKPQLHRLTTRYDADEDRLSLSATTADGQVHAIWLTQRLLLRVLPHLFLWLGATLPATKALASPVSEKALQTFSQEAAASLRHPLSPVSIPSPKNVWLVRGIGFKATAHEVRLTFSSGPGGAGEAVVLALAATPLRQWLSILHRLWRDAGWAMSIWPDWVDRGGQVTIPLNPALH